MKTPLPRPPQSKRSIQCVAVIAVACALMTLPTPARAQQFDRHAYEQHAQECVNNLEYAEQALAASNVDRALTYIQLALDPCDAARNLLITGMNSSDLTSRQREALQGDLVSQDSRWATLAARLGMCEEARSMLAETVRIVPSIPSDRQQRYMDASQAVITCVPSATTPGTPGVGTPPVTGTPMVPSGMPLNGTVTVGPGYGLASGSGLAGGPEDANMVFGEPCWGAISSSPNFNLVVAGDSWVRAAARSDGDLTMVVSGPGGTFCNDDSDGLNPGLYEWLLAGTYQVWIGEFTRSPSGTAFTAEFSTDTGTPQVGTTLVPTYGYVTVGPGYAPTSGAGMAGGPQDANMIFGEPCRGYIPAAPQYQLDVTAYGRVTVQANSSGDLTLIVTGAGGTYCNDDFQGLNPAISEYMAAGTYYVYIGEYSSTGTGTTYDARFSTEELAPSNQGGYGALTSTYGSAYVGPGYGMTTLNGVSGGNLDAATMYGGMCVGSVAQTPDFLLEVTQAATVSVSVNATDGGDTTLVITGPSGTFCNDDSQGLNPGITQYLSPGTYQVYSGSYYQGEYHNIVVNFSSY